MAITLTSIYPATGSAGGGETVSITGTNLDTATSVKFGAVDAASFEAVTANLIRTVVPSHAAGAVDVVVSDGVAPATLTAAYTYSAVDATEQLVSTLARKFRVEVNTGTTSVPVWTQVRAISDLKPSIDTNLEDDSDYDSEGWQSQVKTQLGWALEIKCGRKIGFSTGVYDPGQEFLRAASTSFGTDGTVELRWYDRNGGPEAYSGFATVGWSPEGGDTKTLDMVTITLTGSGKRTDITNPAA